MFKAVKYIKINGTKTFAQKCTKANVMQVKMLSTSSPAYLQKQYLMYEHVQQDQSNVCKSNSMYMSTRPSQILHPCVVSCLNVFQVNNDDTRRNYSRQLTLLTLSFLMLPFDPPKNIRKSLVFWIFQPGI